MTSQGTRKGSERSDECSCEPGSRCQRCTEKGRAILRMMRLAKLYRSEHPDPVAYADQVTSMCDARAALCIAVGVPLEYIAPASGHDLTPRRPSQLALLTASEAVA